MEVSNSIEYHKMIYKESEKLFKNFQKSLTFYKAKYKIKVGIFKCIYFIKAFFLC